MANHGGGIFCRKSSPVKSDNDLLENEAPGGGGIYAHYDRAAVDDI
jgi:hypothetical protein